MLAFIKSIVAAKRLLRLGGSIQGEIPVLDHYVDGQQAFLTLPTNEDTLPAGKQSMFWDSREGHALVEPITTDSHSVRCYRVLKQFGKEPSVGDKVWLSGWLGERPEDFGLVGVRDQKMPNGTMAYLAVAGPTWVIHVHGRNASRAETLRNFATIAALGFSQLSISLESDRPPDGLGIHRSYLGTREWTQVESAIRYAYGNGASRIILFGFSLGAMIIGQCLQRSALGQSVAGVVFDSPLIDIESTLRLQAEKAGERPNFASYGIRKILRSRIFRLLGLGLEYLPSLIVPLGRPALVLYSATDGYVCMQRIPEMSGPNPQGIFINFPGGRHCRLYNQNPERYSSALTNFLEQFGT
ncbi:MAG: hypothetical protein RL523_1076 [Actinomycetota bacterium]